MISTNTVQLAKQELEAMLHGTTLNQIENISGVFNRAARRLLLDIDPQETKTIKQTQTIFDGVFDYVAPTDLKGNKIIDVRPQVNRQLKDIFIQRYGQEFDVNKFFTRQPMFALRFDGGNKTLRVNAPLRNTNNVINNIDGVTTNGTWTGGSGASNLLQDTINFAEGGGALKFDISAGSASAFVVNSTMSVADLTNFQNVSSIFLWVFMPTGADFTSVNLLLGSSATNYWTFTATQNHQGNSFINGWNLLRFDWTNTISATGSPAVASVNYAKVIFNTNGNAESAVRLCFLSDDIGLVYDIEYYSKYIFADSTGVLKETTSSDSDIINLDTDAYNLFLWALARESAHQQHSKDAQFDISYYEQNYKDAKEKYTKQYPSEAQKGQQNYYNMPERRYTRFLGRNYFG